LLEFIVAGGLATTVKAGLDLLGFPVGDPRAPLLPLDEQGAPSCSACWPQSRPA